jgi:hypothetical protein
MNRASDRSFRQIVGDAVDLLTKYSIPLYVNDRYGRPDQFGTAFFVRAGQSQFLVSAAHVLDQTRNERVFYYATPTKLRSLTGRVLTTGHPDHRDRDPLDVGVMRLVGGALPPYREVDKFAVDISYLKPDHVPRAGRHYVIVGFPATKSSLDTLGRTAYVSPYAYRSDSIEDKEYAAKGVDPQTHVVLPLDLKKGFDPAGSVRAFPKPQGMSGAPIVVLYETRAEDHTSFFPVVAIGTRYRKSAKILIGTDVRFALGAIEEFQKV